jgi:hypothetical protein
MITFSPKAAIQCQSRERSFCHFDTRVCFGVRSIQVNVHSMRRQKGIASIIIILCLWDIILYRLELLVFERCVHSSSVCLLYTAVSPLMYCLPKKQINVLLLQLDFRGNIKVMHGSQSQCRDGTVVGCDCNIHKVGAM